MSWGTPSQSRKRSDLLIVPRRSRLARLSEGLPLRYRPHASYGYPLAVISVALALLLRLAVDRWLGDQSPYVMFVVAVAVTGLFAGVRPALLAAALGDDPRSSVVDKYGRTHDIANLFVCDGSVMPTQGSANPGLTIQALAVRTADYLISQGNTIFSSDRRDMERPRFRPDLAPPETWGKGVPRLA